MAHHKRARTALLALLTVPAIALAGCGSIGAPQVDGSAVTTAENTPADTSGTSDTDRPVGIGADDDRHDRVDRDDDDDWDDRDDDWDDHDDWDDDLDDDWDDDDDDDDWDD